MNPVRLYVGGLPAGVSAADLQARFTPFGEVTDLQLATTKQYGDAAFPRDFAHVSLRPKDEAALRKCISAYNGCKWKGGVLRCGLARQHYAERLAAERAGGGGGTAASGSEQADEVGRSSARIKLAAVLPLDPGQALVAVLRLSLTSQARWASYPLQAALPPLEPGTVLRLRPPKAPTAFEVQLGSGAKLSSFTDTANGRGGPAGEAAWEPLPTPPRSGYRFEAHLQRIAADLPPQLLAAVEERRERGRRLAEARQAAAQQAAGATMPGMVALSAAGTLSPLLLAQMCSRAGCCGR